METNEGSGNFSDKQQKVVASSSSSNASEQPLIDPKLLEGLTENERNEALAAAAAARRAEERAEQRAIQRALQQREYERKLLFSQQQQQQQSSLSSSRSTNDVITKDDDRVVFVSKKQRLKLNNNNNNNGSTNGSNSSNSNNNDNTNVVSQKQRQSFHEKAQNNIKEAPITISKNSANRAASASAAAASSSSNLLSENELKIIRETYLGKSGTLPDEGPIEKKKQQQQKSFNKKITFKFRWDETDDTYNDDDPLYNTSLMQQQQQRSQPGRYNTTTTNYGSNNYDESNSNNINKKRKLHTASTILQERLLGSDTIATVSSVTTKPLHLMTTRDWRIFRENYEIIVKGGKVPPPMRSFQEIPLPNELPTLHPSLLSSINTVFCFKEPSPIQRQAIPIGLQRRDLIGIAETGSGKTIAFGVPLCQYILSLPQQILNGVADNGPLGIVMAPTRELALQIDNELQKLLSKQTRVTTYAVVGGQPIQQQAQVLRTGIHILVGTPGRINDCIDMAYLVLNQCCYIVMDEVRIY